MLQHGIQPDVVSCTALISALATGGQWQQSEQVVSWMLQSGVRPNVRTYTALLNSLGQARQWQRAVVLLKRMSEVDFGGVEPNAYCYSALLKSLGEHGQWELAEQVFSELETEALGARGLMPSPELSTQTSPNAMGQHLGYSSPGSQSFNQSVDTPQQDTSIWANVVDIIGLSSQQLAQALQGQMDQAVLGTNQLGAWNAAPDVRSATASTPQVSSGSIEDSFSLFAAPGSQNGYDHQNSGRKGAQRTKHREINEVVCGALMMAYSKAGKVSIHNTL